MRLRWLVLGLVVVVLMVPAAALTVDRLLTPSGGLWVRLLAFAQYAVALYGLALLLLLVAWAAGAGGWRATARVLAVVALVGLGLHLWWALPAYVGSPDAAGTGRPFEVMTANLRLGQASPSEIVSTAVHDDVHLLVLEEVTPVELGQMETAGLHEAYPYTAGAPAQGPHGTMVFSDSRITAVRRLGTAFGSYSMSVHAPAGSYTLIAVHPRPPIGDAAGWAQDQAVIRRAASQVGTVPAVIAGDFNATLDHAPMRALEGDGFSDAATQADSGWQPTWPASGERSVLGVPIPSLVPIDHLLVNSGLRALDTQTVTVSGTDHRALLARLEP